MLGDILLYILTGRGYWTAVGFEQGSQEFVRILLYIANLLLIQETLLSVRPDERQRFLRQLEAAQLNHFFASPEERQAYQDLVAFQDRITVRNPRRLYKVMDSVLPRTPGIVYELVVYVHLLIRRLGYSVPLLIIQRLFRGQETLAPPDYLLLRPDGNVIGIEVAQMFNERRDEFLESSFEIRVRGISGIVDRQQRLQNLMSALSVIGQSEILAQQLFSELSPAKVVNQLFALFNIDKDELVLDQRERIVQQLTQQQQQQAQPGQQGANANQDLL